MNEIEIIRSLIFWGCASIIIIFAKLTILSNKISYALVASILAFFAVGGIYFLLSAEYNAVVQIALYCVAIPILFAFAIMFTNSKTDKSTFLTTKPRLYFTIFSSFILFLSVIYISAMSINLAGKQSFMLAKQVDNVNIYQMFNAICNGFFVNYSFAFILLSVLLLICIIGLSTLNLTKEKKND